MDKVLFAPVPFEDLIAAIKAAVREEIEYQKQNDINEKLLTPKEASDLLKVSLVTIWQWEKNGLLKRYLIGGKAYFKNSEIMKEIESGLGKYSKKRGK